MKKKIIRTEGGIDPNSLPTIKYCKKHEHFINLYPVCQPNLMNGFRVVCPDCGSFGPWKNTVKEAIEIWNEKYGVSA